MATSKAVIPRLTWDKVRPAPVVLVSGTEDFLADRAIRLLRDILRAEDPSLEITDLDAAGLRPGGAHHPGQSVAVRGAADHPGRPGSKSAATRSSPRRSLHRGTGR